MNEFNALKIDLHGKHLIEASAGTGKTYSVTIIALRLLLETDVKINEILMVTFTENAAAEMAERLRVFVRKALNYKLGNNMDCDKQIKDVVDNCKSNDSVVIEKLKQAALNLDEINVSTIHGFCQRTLTEFAFETGQEFSTSVIENDKEIKSVLINQMYRTKVAIKGDVSKGKLIEKFEKYIPENDVEGLGEVIKEISEQTRLYKKQKSLITYDDMIKNLYDVAVGASRNKTELAKKLSDKYKAVFIDEFQDTDKYQFRVFDELFPNTPAYFIGDPKQSIYSFRNADLNSYISVKSNGSITQHTMNTNYRSSASFVKSLNKYYEHQRNPFNHDLIKYNPVESSKDRATIMINGTELMPISFLINNDFKADEKSNVILKRVCSYLNDGKIIEKGRERRILPSDIAILLRAGSRAAEIQNKLQSYAIPAIRIDNTNIFATDEAELVRLMVKLLILPQRAQFLSFLSQPFIGYSFNELDKIDFSREVEVLKELQSQIINKGAYYVLHKLLSEYHNPEKVKVLSKNEYARMKANVFQTIDAVHEKITYDNIGFSSIPLWMEREKSNLEEENDQKIKRIESDEEAVKIVTQHKAKGLEYNICIIPNYNRGPKIKWTDEEYRVLYVAATRSKYKTDFISANNGSSSCKQVIETFPKDTFENSEFFDFNIDILEEPKKYESGYKVEVTESSRPEKVNKSWRVISYSGLASHQDYLAEETEAVLGEKSYDNFVFNEMPKGKDAGVFLHSVFEDSDFQSTDFNDYLKQNQAKFRRFLSNNNIEFYNDLIKNVTTAKYNDFSLVSIAKQKRLNEFEYHLAINKKFKAADVNAIFGRSVASTSEEIEGILKGFIDLVFEHDNKYYLLDWKSNYLGNTVAAYTDDKLKSAMESSSYDLQYHIYTLALCKFLEKRIDGFNFDTHFGGGFWVYLRGCRAGSNSGVCFMKPDKEIYLALKELFL